MLQAILLPVPLNSNPYSMNRIPSNPFRNYDRQRLIDTALILFIIIMTFTYKLLMAQGQ